jgi:hypothetical protein
MGRYREIHSLSFVAGSVNVQRILLPNYIVLTSVLLVVEILVSPATSQGWRESDVNSEEI